MWFAISSSWSRNSLIWLFTYVMIITCFKIKASYKLNYDIQWTCIKSPMPHDELVPFVWRYDWIWHNISNSTLFIFLSTGLRVAPCHIYLNSSFYHVKEFNTASVLSRYESATSFYTALFIVELYYSIFLNCIVFFLDCKLLIDYCYMQSAVELSKESDCFVFL